MSGQLHPTISAWTRDPHEGHYTAELHDYKLVARWKPNKGDRRGSFYWTAERTGHKLIKSESHFEELEIAMADAEQFAALDARRRTRQVMLAAKGGGDH